MQHKTIIHMDIEGPDLEDLDSAIDDLIDQGMEVLAEEIEWAWRHQAASLLTSSKQKYLDGLSISVYDKEIQVELDGPVASGVESGSKSFDLKPGFLKGRESRVIPMGRDGYIGPKNVHNGPRDFIVTKKSPGWIHPGILTYRPHLRAKSIGDRVQEELDNGKLDEVFGRLFDNLKI